MNCEVICHNFVVIHSAVNVGAVSPACFFVIQVHPN